MNVFGNKKRLSLAAKFNTLAILLVLATSVGICLFIIRLEITNYYEELLRHGKTIADTTSKNAEFGIYTEDQASLLPILESLAVDSEIAYVSVMNRDRRTLAYRVFKGSAALPEFTVPVGPNSAEITHRDLIDERDGKSYIEILSPVVGAGGGDITDVLLKSDARKPRIIGYLRLGLTQEGLKHHIRRLLVSITLFTSLLVLIGSAFTILLSRRITSPIKRLTAASHDIAEGKFGSPIEIRTNDEVSDLA